MEDREYSEVDVASQTEAGFWGVGGRLGEISGPEDLRLVELLAGNSGRGRREENKAKQPIRQWQSLVAEVGGVHGWDVWKELKRGGKRRFMGFDVAEGRGVWWKLNGRKENE